MKVRESYKVVSKRKGMESVSFLYGAVVYIYIALFMEVGNLFGRETQRVCVCVWRGGGGGGEVVT